MSLENLSTGELRAASVDLEHQIRALRERRVQIARELERRLPEPAAEIRVVGPQIASPGFIESEAEVASPADPKRRWFNR